MNNNTYKFFTQVIDFRQGKLLMMLIDEWLNSHSYFYRKEISQPFESVILDKHYHGICDPSHRTGPDLTYLFFDETIAIEFKLKFGDYFGCSVIESKS